MANRQQTQTPDFIPDTTPDFIPDTTPDFIPDEEQKPSLLNRVLDPANRFASSALSSLGLPTSLSDVPRWGRHMIGQDPGQQPALKELIQAHAEAGKESPVGYVPIIGPASVEMARQNREGNYAGALGTAAGTVAGASPMAGPAADLTSKVKDYAGSTLRNERGAVRPGVKALTKLAQVGAGLGTGGSEGMLTGALLPNLADTLIPNRPPPSFKPISELRPTGAYTDPLAAAAKPDPFGGMTSSRESTWNAELPKVTATTPQQPFPRLAEKVKASTGSTAQVEKLPVPREPVAGETPGSMASVPRGRLLNPARQGRPGAAEQYRNTGKTVLYTTPEYPSRGSSLIDRVRESSEPEIELIDQGGPNASGESSASREAIGRSASEKAAGTRRIAIDIRSGQERPLVGVDAVDARPGPYDRIVMRDANGNERVLDQGHRALPRRPRR